MMLNVHLSIFLKHGVLGGVEMGLFTRERATKIVEIAIDRIQMNPYQPRKAFDQEKLAELSASISEIGLLQPIIVRRVNNNYELIAGERRLRAAVMANLTAIPAIIKEFTDQEIARAALIENIQRENLNSLEEAVAYQTLLQEFGLTQTELARQMGKAQSTIANKLRLLKLPAGVQALLAGSKLTERHGRALLAIEDPHLCLKTAEKIVAKDWTVRQTTQYIEHLLAVPPPPERDNSNQKRRMIIKDVRIFFNTITMAWQTMVDAGVETEMEERTLPDGRREIIIRIDS